MVAGDEETDEDEDEEDVFEVAKRLAKAQADRAIRKREKEIARRIEKDVTDRYEKEMESLRADLEKRESKMREEAERLRADFEKESKRWEKEVSQKERELTELRGKVKDLEARLRSVSTEYEEFKKSAALEIKAKEEEVRKAKDAGKAELEAARKRLEGEFAKREGELQRMLEEERRRVDDIKKDADGKLARLEEDLRERAKVEVEKVRLESQNALLKAREATEREVTKRLNEEHAKREEALREQLTTSFEKKEAELRTRLAAEREAQEKEREKRLKAEIARMEESVRAKLELEQKNREVELRENLTKQFEAEMKARLEKEKDSARAMLELEYKRREELIRQNIEEEMRKRLESELAAVGAGQGVMQSAMQFPKEPFPFTAIVGHERVKRALILNAVNPRLGGVLLWGSEGNGKRTMVLAMASLLEGTKGPDGNPLRPWDAEERYLVGVFPSAQTFASGMMDFDQNVGILNYTRNLSEKNEFRFALESMAREHFMILERFVQMAIHLRVEAPEDPTLRMEIAKRAREYSSDPKKFRKQYETEEKRLRERIFKARDALPKLSLPSKIAGKISQMCHVKGLPIKMDVLLAELARTNAALDGRDTVTSEDVQEAADLVLAYRMDEEMGRMVRPG